MSLILQLNDFEALVPGSYWQLRIFVCMYYYINILLSFPEIPETKTSRAISTHTSHFHTPSHFLSNHHHPTVSSSIPKFALCNVECKLSYGVQRMPRRVSKDTNMI